MGLNKKHLDLLNNWVPYIFSSFKLSRCIYTHGGVRQVSNNLLDINSKLEDPQEHMPDWLCPFCLLPVQPDSVRSFINGCMQGESVKARQICSCGAAWAAHFLPGSVGISKHGKVRQ